MALIKITKINQENLQILIEEDESENYKVWTLI